jgi:hypothetical protein
MVQVVELMPCKALSSNPSTESWPKSSHLPPAQVANSTISLRFFCYEKAVLREKRYTVGYPGLKFLKTSLLNGKNPTCLVAISGRTWTSASQSPSSFQSWWTLTVPTVKIPPAEGRA